LGVFVFLVTFLAFFAGRLRNELALTLLGAVFLAIFAWCFLAVLITGAAGRKKGLSLSAGIVTKLVTAGENAEVRITGGAGKLRFFRLPGALIRYELRLATRDQRIINHLFDPQGKESSFPVSKRGAYYGAFDRFTIFDAPGFFHLSFPIPQDGDPRLLAAPRAVEEPLPLPFRSGGTEQRVEPHYRKTDDLTDHRPYVPGDDPRRINWKLYGHAPEGELFVREGENEPPPQARILILIDTQADPSLFTAGEARQAVDLLCENALAAALEFSSQGMDIFIGYSGGEIHNGSLGSHAGIVLAELAAVLARPAALSLLSPEDLPEAPRDLDVLILALPRLSTEPGGLDRFLRNRESTQGADLFFLYDAETPRAAEWETAAEACVRFYNRKMRIRAWKFAVSSAGRTLKSTTSP
jgi:uncharacterized protein (DUF58 family)